MDSNLSDYNNTLKVDYTYNFPWILQSELWSFISDLQVFGFDPDIKYRPIMCSCNTCVILCTLWLTLRTRHDRCSWCSRAGHWWTLLSKKYYNLPSFNCEMCSIIQIYKYKEMTVFFYNCIIYVTFISQNFKIVFECLFFFFFSSRKCRIQQLLFRHTTMSKNL